MVGEPERTDGQRDDGNDEPEPRHGLAALMRRQK
jgi:hypothetical protein